MNNLPVIHDRSMYNRNMAGMTSSMQLGPPEEAKFRAQIQHGQNTYGLPLNHIMPSKPTKTYIDQIHPAHERLHYGSEQVNMESPPMHVAPPEFEKQGIDMSANDGKVYEVLGNTEMTADEKKKSGRKFTRRFPQKWIKEGTFARFYIVQSRKDRTKAYCRVCMIELAGSATQIERHIETKKHRTAAGLPEDEELPLPSKTPKGLIPRDKRLVGDLFLDNDQGDADMNFFRGVLPHIKVLSAKAKLSFQLRTLELLNSFPLNGDAEEEDHLIIH